MIYIWTFKKIQFILYSVLELAASSYTQFMAFAINWKWLIHLIKIMSINLCFFWDNTTLIKLHRICIYYLPVQICFFHRSGNLSHSISSMSETHQFPVLIQPIKQDFSDPADFSSVTEAAADHEGKKNRV